MFHKILIANRGEIALRILRACRELGIRAVVAHSRRTPARLAVRLADEAICIGPAAAPRQLPAHPGDHLARRESRRARRSTRATASCPRTPSSPRSAASAGITFIGPPPEVIATAWATRSQARADARRGGVPVMPGSERAARSVRRGARAGRRDRLPGDAQGRRRRRRARDARGPRARRRCAGATHAASPRRRAAFGNGRPLPGEVRRGRPPRRGAGARRQARATRVHLGERDCSMQRRHQKLIEEAPSPVHHAEDARKASAQAALAAAQARSAT